jgi:transcriptional regulator with XRE-family HTH domain
MAERLCGVPGRRSRDGGRSGGSIPATTRPVLGMRDGARSARGRGRNSLREEGAGCAPAPTGDQGRASISTRVGGSMTRPSSSAARARRSAPSSANSLPRARIRAVAAKLDISPSVVSYWETGKRVPTTEDVASYLTAVGVTATDRETVLDLARGATETDWLTTGIPGVSQQLAGVLECERSASAITEWSIGTIPGLLQTADYARAIIGSSSPDAEAKVSLRLSRRDALTRPRDPVRLTALLSEMALRQVIGGTEVMADQLRYLLQAAELPTVTLQVIPIGAGGWHPGLAGPFVLYDFPAAPSIVHLEHHRNGAFVYDSEDVAAYNDARDKVREAAMSPDDSTGLIADVVNGEETTG